MHVGKLRTRKRSAPTREKRHRSGCRAFRETRSGRSGRSSRGSRVAHQPEDRYGSAIARAILAVLPIVGFYLQPAVGGRVLPYSFWRRFAEIETVVAIKVAAFNRYQSLDVVRAVAAAGRDDVALYTGNDDNIVADLTTPHRFAGRDWRFVGGLLGHWSVWTRRAVELLERCQREPASPDLARLGVEVTDSNAAFFDAANGFHGCIAGLHEVLRRQGLLEGIWCLDEKEGLSPGQLEEIDRVYAVYPHLNDDDFVIRHRDEWLRG